MNPTSAPGTSPSDSPPAPTNQPPTRPAQISVPQRAPEPVQDMPDSAFGFADDNPPMPETPPIQAQPTAQATPNVAPAPPLPRPTALPAAEPAPAPAPKAATIMSAPAAPNPMPADAMPPKNIPAVPTPLAPTPESQLAAPSVPTSNVPPAPTTNLREAQPIPLSSPVASAPTQAGAPVTASYSPPASHVPDDVAARITETPIQNSSDIAKEIARGGRHGRFKSIVSFLIFTAAIFVAAFLINQFIFQSYYVEGTSMTPTLQNNDRLIISKVEKTWANVLGRSYIPDRGQIVVLDSSIVGLNGQKEQLIKRVIGLPGDHLHIENGVVTITNKDHPNGYDVDKDLGLTYLQDTYVDAPLDVTIPDGQVFVMGDNRAQNGSYDSRAFGPIDGDKIQGRLWARILPLDKIRSF